MVQFQGTHQIAARVLWKILKYDIEGDEHVLHICDNPKCLNIEHLFVGTHKDNMEDMSIKGRAFNSKKDKCMRGHEFTKKNTYVTTRGHRVCRVCQKARQYTWRKNMGIDNITEVLNVSC